MAAAFAGLFLVEGIVWGALSFAASTMQSLTAGMYPYGVYDQTVVALINFGTFAMPFVILVSAVIMVALALQRE